MSSLEKERKSIRENRVDNNSISQIWVAMDGPPKIWNSISFGATHLSTPNNGGYFNSSHLRE